MCPYIRLFVSSLLNADSIPFFESLGKPIQGYCRRENFKVPRFNLAVSRVVTIIALGRLGTVVL